MIFQNISDKRFDNNFLTLLNINDVEIDENTYFFKFLKICHDEYKSGELFDKIDPVVIMDSELYINLHNDKFLNLHFISRHDNKLRIYIKFNDNKKYYDINDIIDVIFDKNIEYNVMNYDKAFVYYISSKIDIINQCFNAQKYIIHTLNLDLSKPILKTKNKNSDEFWYYVNSMFLKYIELNTDIKINIDNMFCDDIDEIQNIDYHISDSHYNEFKKIMNDGSVVK